MLESPVSLPAATPPMHGYDRQVVEAFLASVALERERLLTEIAAARRRSATVRAAMEAERVIHAMLGSACDEITAKRRQAEIVVARLAATEAAGARGSGGAARPAATSLNVRSEPNVSVEMTPRIFWRPEGLDADHLVSSGGER